MLLHREEDGQATPSTIEAAAARTATASATDDAFSESYHSPPMPLAYDADPRNLDCLKGKLNKFKEDEGLREANTKDSSLELFLQESKTDFGYFYTPKGDEDVCPTCLEGTISLKSWCL